LAVLDTRLLPLIETLTEAGADWLAFELVDGIRRGVEAEEPEELLVLARERVRSGVAGERRPMKLAELATPILGDDQIVWAAQYVVNRLDAALADLAAASNLLEAIADAPPPHGARYQVQAVRAGGPEPVKIVVGGEEGSAVTRDGIEAARGSMQKFRQALDAWSSVARDIGSV
jgi:hypothetical protein